MNTVPYIIVVLGGMILSMYVANMKFERQSIIDQEILVQNW